MKEEYIPELLGLHPLGKTDITTDINTFIANLYF